MSPQQLTWGVGLRSTHFPFLSENKPGVSEWFEAISENYMLSEGRQVQMLEKIRQDFPVALHGVSLSIASPEPVLLEYLRGLKTLVQRIDPFLISDHFCWTSFGGHNSHDLLPFPMNQKMVNHLVGKIQMVQEFLGRQILLENASAYVSFEESDMPEWEFITTVSQKAGNKILLDLNNVFVNSCNFNFQAKQFIEAIPGELVGQIHLAGHTHMGTHLFDTHSSPICDEVLTLLCSQVERTPNAPVMLEWDEDIPNFLEVENEIKRAKSAVQAANSRKLSSTNTTWKTSPQRDFTIRTSHP